MNELERVREQLAKWIYELWFEPDLPYRCGWMAAAPDWKQVCYNKADQILSLKGIRIACDVQSLPYYEYANRDFAEVQHSTQQAMLKPDSEGNHWVKVGPKGEI